MTDMTTSTADKMLKTLFVSLLDKNDRPLLVHAMDTESSQLEIKYNVLSNLALDYFGETTKGNMDAPPFYFFEMHEIVVYGEYLGQKGLKIVIGFNMREDDAIVPFFQKVKLYYLKSVINPFNDDWINQIRHKLDTLQLD